MMKTPAPPVDVGKAIPGLDAFARTTVRLHPRRGQPSADGSKIGGPFLWPSAEPWPECNEHRSPYVTALQLRKEDVPEVGFKDGTDLFQVLWCPNDHEPGYCPKPQVFWRKRTEITNSGGPPVRLDRINKEYVPATCTLNPERVIEYPDVYELSDDFQKKIRDSEDLKAVLGRTPPQPKDAWHSPGDASELYQFWLSTAAGTKIAGYPDWIQDPEYPRCSCGATTEHLVTFASYEFDGISWGRWLPLEERQVLSATYDARIAVQSAPGWMFGDAGCLYLFICRRCEGWPITALMQSS